MSSSDNFSSMYDALVEEERRNIHPRLVEIFLLSMIEKTDISIPIAIRTKTGVQLKEDMFSAVFAMCASAPTPEFEMRRALRMVHAENAVKFLDSFKQEAAKVYADSYATLMAEIKVHSSISRTLGGGDEQ